MMPLTGTLKLERVFRSFDPRFPADPTVNFPRAEVTAISIAGFHPPVFRRPATEATGGAAPPPPDAEPPIDNLHWLLAHQVDEYRLYIRGFKPSMPDEGADRVVMPYMDLLRFEPEQGDDDAPLVWRLASVKDLPVDSIQDLLEVAVLSIFSEPHTPDSKRGLMRFYASGASSNDICQSLCTPPPRGPIARFGCQVLGCI